MVRLESIEDNIRGVARYKLSNGTIVCFDARMVREIGAAELLRQMGHGHLLPTGRVAVIFHGRRVGTLPPDFDPLNIKSLSLWYDPRPGDFRREGDAWVTNRTLGIGDLEAVVGFEYGANGTKEG